MGNFFEQGGGQGIVAGATAGSAFGPVGTIVGGLAGGILSGIAGGGSTGGVEQRLISKFGTANQAEIRRFLCEIGVPDCETRSLLLPLPGVDFAIPQGGLGALPPGLARTPPPMPPTPVRPATNGVIVSDAFVSKKIQRVRRRMLQCVCGSFGKRRC